MDPIPYAGSALLVLAFAWLVFRGLIRREYRRRGRLTWWQTLLQLLVFCAWAFFGSLQYAAVQPHPDLPPALRAIGWIVFCLGVVATLAAGGRLGTRASFGLTAPALHASGLYGVVRNPQVSALGFGLLGYLILWPTWRIIGVVLLYFPIAHLMVITEEEHLARTLRGRYQEYLGRVPRYVPRLRSSRRAAR